MSVSPPRFGKGGSIIGDLGVKPPTAGGQGDLGATPPPANEFLRFSHKKHSFYRKRGCSDAVTMDNAKIFPQVVSKSRDLAKISERWLQPLLVQKIVD